MFCTQFNFTPLPVNETILCRFVAFLVSQSLSPQSIRSYLSAVRHLQVMSGLPDPLLSSYPLLDYALRGAKRDNKQRRQQRLPITPAILRRIYQTWSREPTTYDRIMLWSAFLLGFFGFMRAGEFTCPSQTAFSSAMLTVGDVAVDSHISPTRMTVLVKQSKTDPFGAGTTLQFGATGDYLCPVTAMLGYLAVRPPSPGPLFVFEDGATLSRARLVQSLHEALVLVGMDDGRFSGHSFRIGAATAAASAGLQDSLIKTLGRWRSSAYTVYIQTPWQRLAAVSAALSSASSSIT